jgi:anti-anti-sigma factor
VLHGAYGGPVEIDITNAEETGVRLRAVLAPGATVIADLTDSEFCDVKALRVLAEVCRQAAVVPCEVRLAVCSPVILRAIELTGSLDPVSIYPTVATAIPPAFLDPQQVDDVVRVLFLLGEDVFEQPACRLIPLGRIG